MDTEEMCREMKKLMAEAGFGGGEVTEVKLIKRWREEDEEGEDLGSQDTDENTTMRRRLRRRFRNHCHTNKIPSDFSGAKEKFDHEHDYK